MFRAGILLTLLAVVPFIPAGSARAQQTTPSKTKTVRLLTVGNSFSQNATRYLDDLVKAKGHTLIHRPLAIGGASMQVHWDKAQLHEKDPKDPKGLYGTKSLRQELMSAAWDSVTIQQASIKSHDVATYRPFAKQLHDYIGKAAPKTELLVHQTWAYRVDDPRFAKRSKTPGEPATQKEMYDGLTKAYQTIAGELGARQIPVGEAMYLADTNAQWGYRPDRKFDFKNALPPSLPDQTHSLHTGWRWGTAKDGKKSLTMDGHHASVAGQYLAACVFYEVLFKESVVGNSFAPQEIDRAYARFLQETAHQAVVMPDVPDVVQRIREEVAKANRDPGGRPLPVASHWANGFNGTNFSSDYQIGLLEKGHHLVPTLPFPQPGAQRYPPAGKPFVEKLARWRAPFALRAGQWESVLYEKNQPLGDPGKWRNLPAEKSPLDINLAGKIKAKLSPWGAVAPWHEAGLYQTGSRAFKELQQWYPDPPRVLLMSNNEANKLRPKEDVEAESKRYLDAYGKGKPHIFIRSVMADGYVERYRALIKGIKEGLPNDAWRNNSLTVAYGGFGPSHFGRMDSWKAYSYATEKRMHPWHLAWEGGSPSYYVHDWDPSTDYRVWSPQVEANNWVFMLDETYRENPDFWFELSIWDGNLAVGQPAKGKVNKKDHYLKAGQEWSADRYAGFVQYGMWLLTPRVVREFRGRALPRAAYGQDFEALLAGVDRVWTDPVLTRFWRHGKLVANPTHKHPYQIGIPEQWQAVDRWFQLDTSIDPPRPWKLDTELPVFSLARFVGEKGTREWLVYAHAPVKTRKDVAIDLPDFGKVTVNVTPRGSFYLVKEKDRSVSAVAD